MSPETARRFRVENRARRNRIGDPVAYELVPGENVRPMQQPDSQVRERARFLDHHLWVTPYRPDERYPAGEYPNQHAGGDGLPRWTAADRSRSTRTSCSGTCSAPTTSRGSRTGR